MTTPPLVQAGSPGGPQKPKKTSGTGTRLVPRQASTKSAAQLELERARRETPTPEKLETKKKQRSKAADERRIEQSKQVGAQLQKRTFVPPERTIGEVQREKAAQVFSDLGKEIITGGRFIDTKEMDRLYARAQAEALAIWDEADRDAQKRGVDLQESQDDFVERAVGTRQQFERRVRDSTDSLSSLALEFGKDITPVWGTKRQIDRTTANWHNLTTKEKIDSIAGITGGVLGDALFVAPVAAGGAKLLGKTQVFDAVGITTKGANTVQVVKYLPEDEIDTYLNIRKGGAKFQDIDLKRPSKITVEPNVSVSKIDELIKAKELNKGSVVHISPSPGQIQDAAKLAEKLDKRNLNAVIEVSLTDKELAGMSLREITNLANKIDSSGIERISFNIARSNKLTPADQKRLAQILSGPGAPSATINTKATELATSINAGIPDKFIINNRIRRLKDALKSRDLKRVDFDIQKPTTKLKPGQRQVLNELFITKPTLTGPSRATGRGGTGPVVTLDRTATRTPIETRVLGGRSRNAEIVLPVLNAVGATNQLAANLPGVSGEVRISAQGQTKGRTITFPEVSDLPTIGRRTDTKKTPAEETKALRANFDRSFPGLDIGKPGRGSKPPVAPNLDIEFPSFKESKGGDGSTPRIIEFPFGAPGGVPILLRIDRLKGTITPRRGTKGGETSPQKGFRIIEVSKTPIPTRTLNFGVTRFVITGAGVDFQRRKGNFKDSRMNSGRRFRPKVG